MNPMQKPTNLPPSGGPGTPPTMAGGFRGAGGPTAPGMAPAPGMAGGAPGPQMPNFMSNPTLGPEQVYSVNPTVQEVLWRRFDMLTPEMMDAIDRAITPENAPVFLALFPELEPLIQEASALGQPEMEENEQEEGDDGEEMKMRQPPGPMTPPPAGQAGIGARAPMPQPPGGGSRLGQMKFQG